MISGKNANKKVCQKTKNNNILIKLSLLVALKVLSAYPTDLKIT